MEVLPITNTIFQWTGNGQVSELEIGNIGSGNICILATLACRCQPAGSLSGAGGVGGLLAVAVTDCPATNSPTPNSPTHQLFFPLYDANGNITAYVSETGEVVAQYAYDGFGRTLSAMGPLASIFRHRFSTKYLDDETGFYYYGHRYYAPELTRWTTRDPIGEDGGLNLYSFCGNDGVNKIDLLGNSSVAVSAAIELDTQEGTGNPTFPVMVISATVLEEPKGRNFLNFIQIKRVATSFSWEIDTKINFPYYYPTKEELLYYTSTDQNGHRVLKLNDSPRGAYSESVEFVSSVVEVMRKCKKVLPYKALVCTDKVKVLDSVRWSYNRNAPIFNSLEVLNEQGGDALMRSELSRISAGRLWQIPFLCPTKIEVE